MGRQWEYEQEERYDYPRPNRLGRQHHHDHWHRNGNRGGEYVAPPPAGAVASSLSQGVSWMTVESPKEQPHRVPPPPAPAASPRRAYQPAPAVAKAAAHKPRPTGAAAAAPPPPLPRPRPVAVAKSAPRKPAAAGAQYDASRVIADDDPAAAIAAARARMTAG